MNKTMTIKIKNRHAYPYLLLFTPWELSKKPIKYFVNINESITNKNGVLSKIKKRLNKITNCNYSNTKERFFYSNPGISSPINCQINDTCTWFELCVGDCIGSGHNTLVICHSIKNDQYRLSKIEINAIENFLYKQEIEMAKLLKEYREKNGQL